MRRKLLYKNSLVVAATVLAFLLAATAAFAQSSGFTYQGRLTDGGTAANGNYDLQFALWDSLSGGTRIGSTQTLNTVAVSNGGVTVFPGFRGEKFSREQRFFVDFAPATQGSFPPLSPPPENPAHPLSVFPPPSPPSPPPA